MPLWLPNGAKLRRTLERYIVDLEERLGYQHVYTPVLANVELYKISGHWEHYQEDMFPTMTLDNEELVLRPMNCPHHMMVYKSEMRSYRDLPHPDRRARHDAPLRNVRRADRSAPGAGDDAERRAYFLPAGSDQGRICPGR